ncbi:MAG: hypothetical protein IPL61_21260 [Myxococcales bacterium]|nr:hypothetical protein [Myxococcales bacterium]
MIGIIGMGVLKALQVTCPHCRARQTRVAKATGPTLTCKYCHKPFPCPARLRKK